MLAGCRASHVPAEQPDAQSSTESTVEILPIPPESVEVTVPKQQTGEPEGERLPMTMGGCTRLPYSGNVSAVRYVTSPGDLPDIPEMQEYDDAWFREKALLLVTETVNNGSVRVEIGEICLDGDTAFVVLSREMQGDVGTTVMTTWLVWAEVEQGLSCDWVVENPATIPDTQRS